MRCQIIFTWTISAFSFPAHANTHTLALLTTGNVIVIRLGGGFGESMMGAIHLSVTVSKGWSGNREQVCPSGPIPSSSMSNDGSFTFGKILASFSA